MKVSGGHSSVGAPSKNELNEYLNDGKNRTPWSGISKVNKGISSK